MSTRHVTFAQAIELFSKNYLNFSGRSWISAFWWWALASFLIGLGLSIADTTIFGTVFEQSGPLSGAWSLITLIPGLAIGVPRLHDIDKSGWWFLLIFTLIGIIPVFIWWARHGREGPNRFGDDVEAGLPENPLKGPY